MTDAPRILIVEDDPVTARDIRAMLDQNGWQADHRDTLPDGITAATDTSYDVIIPDRMLPGGDGITATANLRATGCQAMVPVVNALGLAQDRTEGLDSGADDYTAKPFEADEP